MLRVTARAPWGRGGAQVNLDDVIRELRTLNEPVPKPLRLPTDAEVEHAQAALGVTFHPGCG